MKKNKISSGYSKDFSGCTLIMGSPGTGKSTLASMIARHAMRAGETVWSTEPIIGCRILNIRDDPHTWDIKNGWVIIDEAGISMGNRDWKGFTTKQIEFFKLYRHYHLRIVILSQDKDDADKKARQLATKIYLMQKTLIPFCVRYDKFRIFVGASDDQTDIVRKYEPIPFWLGGIKYRYRSPAIWKMFDSYCGKQLPTKEWETYMSTSEGVPVAKENKFKKLLNKVLTIKRNNGVVFAPNTPSFR